jgi:phosphoserine phosphatase
VIPAELAARVAAAGRSSPGALAAFDADGTLWREDIGEAFLRHLISLGWVTLPDGGDPYEAYERRVDEDRAAGYAYAAQLQAGLSEEQVAAEAGSFARSWVPPRLIADAAALRELCARAGLLPVVISASALPIVRAAAPLAGFARWAGIETRVVSGRFTAELVLPVTYAAGKVAKAAGLGLQGRLALACGDSLTGDLAMLEAARIAVVVAPASGSPLSVEARRRGWPVLAQETPVLAQGM